MGCDIHLFVDLEHDEGKIVNLSGYQLADIARPYGLFAAIAGVRATPELSPLIPPRGLPPRISDFVWNEFFVPVGNVQRGVSREDAIRGINSDNLAWLYPPDDLKYVQNPLWHSTSFLTCAEVRACCEHTGYQLHDAGECFNDWLEIMRVLDDGFDPGATRMVFWFDN